MLRAADQGQHPGAAIPPFHRPRRGWLVWLVTSPSGAACLSRYIEDSRYPVRDRTGRTLHDLHVRDADKMQAWRDDPAQKDVLGTRDKAAKFRSFVVEGLPQ